MDCWGEKKKSKGTQAKKLLINLKQKKKKKKNYQLFKKNLIFNPKTPNLLYKNQFSTTKTQILL
jgi:hypothetical protein